MHVEEARSSIAGSSFSESYIKVLKLNELCCISLNTSVNISVNLTFESLSFEAELNLRHGQAEVAKVAVERVLVHKF